MGEREKIEREREEREIERQMRKEGGQEAGLETHTELN